MADVVRAALIQAKWAGDKDVMTKNAIRSVQQAAAEGAKVVCLQELFNGPYFCQVQDGAWYDWAEPVPEGPTIRQFMDVARENGTVIVVPVYEVEHFRRLLQHGRGHRRGRALSRKAPEESHSAGRRLLGEVLLPTRQPWVPRIRHGDRSDRRLHLLRASLPRGLACPRTRGREDRLQSLRDQPGDVRAPLEAGAACSCGGERVLRGYDQPGRRGASRPRTSSTASRTSSILAASSSERWPPTSTRRLSYAISTSA